MPDSSDHRVSRNEPAAPLDGFEPSAFVPTLGDRLRDLGADPRAAAAVLAVVVLAAGVLWYRAGTNGSDDVRHDAGASAGGTTDEGSGTAATDTGGATTTTGDTSDGGASVDPTEDIVVHVAGAVTSPGVVRVPPGSRVGDAVDSAGGALGDADLDRLNLAAVLEDGQRILVARRGDPPTDSSGVSGVSGGAGDTSGGGGGGSGDADSASPIDLNAADSEDLEELPGIGPVLAEAIIDERESRGGFRSVNELRDVRGIGEKRFEDLRDRVTV